jgi:AraC-like DNA-binding protein/mannose-6-phosphate isomerase-like protein (cupin superfamily)
MKFSYDFTFFKPDSLKGIETILKQQHDSGHLKLVDYSLTTEQKKLMRDYFCKFPFYAIQNGDAKIQSQNIVHLTDISTGSAASIDMNNGISVNIHPNYHPPVVHDHTFFELICVVDGKGINVSGNQTIKLTAGDIIILAPGTRHSLFTFDDDSFVMNILISPSIFKETFFLLFSESDTLRVFFSSVLFNYMIDSFIYFPLEPDPVIMSVLSQLNNLPSSNCFYSDKIMVTSISFLFARLLYRYEKNVVIYNDIFLGVHQNVAYILHYMQQHYATVTLSELSKVIGYSERHLLRILKTYTGKGFKEIVQYLRVQHAAKFLIESDKTVEEISAICGYTPKALRKIFVAQYGSSPSEYRKVNATQ